ncbi:Secondary metabolism regulator laeA like protein [Verticillium longisporum]|uniref:Secondary metabolism regulator laeA like protein n=1 Tax=Verticillium longisporum TaxID=100787 RepID=A0A8I2ZAD2_VERLO|nr:Secondary metabolism regulator laeA like protein [Verticillium longisporum]
MEYGGYMYAGAAPFPPIYQRTAQEKKKAAAIIAAAAAATAAAAAAAAAAADGDDQQNGDQTRDRNRDKKPSKAPLFLRRAHSAGRKEKDRKPSRFRHTHTRTHSGSSGSVSSSHEAGLSTTTTALSLVTSSSSSSPSLDKHKHNDDNDNDHDADDDSQDTGSRTPRAPTSPGAKSAARHPRYHFGLPKDFDSVDLKAAIPPLPQHRDHGSEQDAFRGRSGTRRTTLDRLQVPRSRNLFSSQQTPSSATSPHHASMLTDGDPTTPHASSFSQTKSPSSFSIIPIMDHTTAAAAFHAHNAQTRTMNSSAMTLAGMNTSNPSLDGTNTTDTPSVRGSTSAASASASAQNLTRPAFALRNSRTYLADTTLPYPLPVDLAELHRQSLRTLLLTQVFGGPVCSPIFADKPPTRVLEIACGPAFWSTMCHRWFAARGHTNISFTGIDVAPIAPTERLDRDMRWRFVQHDLRSLPWPLPDGHFDLVMVKDTSLAIPSQLQQPAMDEYLRLLRPGGVLEIWESDHQVRMLRPHAPVQHAEAAEEPSSSEEEESTEEEEESSSSSVAEDGAASSTSPSTPLAASLGAYLMTANTPLSSPMNPYLVEYNTWLHRALGPRGLSPVPCTLVGPSLLQESDDLTDVRSRRLAIPLAEVRWEREGVGGVVTKDGKSYVRRREGGGRAKRLSEGQAAVRRTAMLTVVQFVQSLEPMLRETSGKSRDEWDLWMGRMVGDLMGGDGAGCGECLEVGAWWARKT